MWNEDHAERDVANQGTRNRGEKDEKDNEKVRRQDRKREMEMSTRRTRSDDPRTMKTIELSQSKSRIIKLCEEHAGRRSVIHKRALCRRLACKTGKHVTRLTLMWFAGIARTDTCARIKSGQRRVDEERRGKKTKFLLLLSNKRQLYRTEGKKETEVARTRLNFSATSHLPHRYSKTDATLSRKDVKPSRKGEKCVFLNCGAVKRLQVSSYVVCQPRFALELRERTEKRPSSWRGRGSDCSREQGTKKGGNERKKMNYSL